MKGIIQSVFIGIGVIIGMGIIAVLAGTILWMLWPYTIPKIFPALVASGMMAGKISWITGVCTSWVFGILVKSTTTISKN
jgi:hypothetical protein